MSSGAQWFKRDPTPKIQNRYRNVQKISLQFYSQKYRTRAKKNKIVAKKYNIFSKNRKSSPNFQNQLPKERFCFYGKIVIFENIFEFFGSTKIHFLGTILRLNRPAINLFFHFQSLWLRKFSTEIFKEIGVYLPRELNL